MCGILLVRSKEHIPVQKHLSALSKLGPRGPDFSRYRYANNIFVGQTVLHITGNRDYYNAEQKNFLSYNGEIYNYQELGNYSNDIEFVHDAVENDLSQFQKAWGPWAWAWTDGFKIKYASDPQGERCLYQYSDDSILVVCSEVAPILEYIDAKIVLQQYTTRHWVMLDHTPWQGIVKIAPGQLYENGQQTQEIDSVFSWINPVSYQNIDQAYEDFKSVWSKVLSVMQPSCAAALTYSGGLDTSIILSHMPDLELYTTNMIGKDPIAERIKVFLTPAEQFKLNQLDIDLADWAQAFNEILMHTRMPVQSWSFVGQWIINKSCQQKVLFTGAGADELFGGYDIYQKLNFTTDRSVSPYSQNGDNKLWRLCLESYNGHAGQATLLLDYWHQIVGCDARGIDLCSGAWGIEARNPFLASPIMKLALNLPFEYKVSTVPKPLIRKLFLERWSDNFILPKKGFTGHCNDALPWLNVNLESTGDRNQDWRQIVIQSFYTRAKQCD